MDIKRFLFQNKNFKLWYYIQVEIRELLGKGDIEKLGYLKDKFADEKKSILERVDYYNKQEAAFSPDVLDRAIGLFKKPNGQKVYYYDSKEFLRYFPGEFRFSHLPGDIVEVPDHPSIVKSRPISPKNQHAVLLNLDKVRHFNFIRDHVPFKNKKNLLFGRATVYQEHRKRFYNQYFNHPLCDLGDVVKGSSWYKPKVSITAHLSYKFILALEGYDVATNLKWIMSSNSIAVMPKPKYETWYMEGKLIGNVHYIEIKDDYSDLEERLDYYIRHEDECLEIIRNAQAFTKQFANSEKEDLVSLMVLEKYFMRSGQLVLSPITL